MSRDQPGKQISLTVFDNEPTARMAEQRLQLEGIPCLVRSLRGGPGLWGSSYNLPHDLLVYEEDVMRAREVLEVPPKEILERERGWDGDGQTDRPSTPLPQWIIIIALVGLVAFIALTVVIADRAIR
ncbi:MAG: DUF2007 domain-containing protein [Chloroflexi bacterium]|nr:DUF2007 domain-containing protein [Chloroflexota bacterium]MDA1271534.1 DUF2007 domain-containing protein [Chloroflexota bacterium]PKB58528.1 MAG: hypothetical protein BZY83_06500 [SAR202 cluster bacterium Casp-Chloro-G2]